MNVRLRLARLECRLARKGSDVQALFLDLDGNLTGVLAKGKILTGDEARHLLANTTDRGYKVYGGLAIERI